MDDGKEGFSLVKIGIGALILLVLVGVIMGITTLGSSNVNKSTNDLANAMDNAAMLQFSRYDNSEVVGSDVLTAVNTYQNSNIKVFVANKGGNGGTAYVPTNLSAGTGEGSTLGTVMSYCYMGVNNAEDSVKPALNSDTGRWEAEIIPESLDEEVFNRNFSPLTDKNNRSSYVRQGAHYWAYLVYDTNTGEHCGILFVQTD